MVQIFSYQSLACLRPCLRCFAFVAPFRIPVFCLFVVFFFVRSSRKIFSSLVVVEFDLSLSRAPPPPIHFNARRELEHRPFWELRETPQWIFSRDPPDGTPKSFLHPFGHHDLKLAYGFYQRFTLNAPLFASATNLAVLGIKNFGTTLALLIYMRKSCQIAL